MKADYSYLIIEGECKLLMEHSTIDAITKIQNPNIKMIVDTSLQSNRGYISKSISHYNIGIIGMGQWFGNDGLVT